MPPNSYDPKPEPAEPIPADLKCPKCDVEMEPIDIEVEGLPLQNLQLCPDCYLVTWSDQDGLHLRQGLPVKAGDRPPNDQAWMVGDPQKC
jgi:hypothetical protein